jgi:hypothetical protein
MKTRQTLKINIFSSNKRNKKQNKKTKQKKEKKTKLKKNYQRRS